MNATERARRSDSLYYDTQVTNRRALCDMIANRESDLTESKAENAKLREQMERLVTLLRVDCDIDASWDGLRRFWYVRLTDEGVRKRDEREATLGRGTMTADDVRDLIERHSDACGGNGRDFHNGAYVAIADELNATLGRGGGGPQVLELLRGGGGGRVKITIFSGELRKCLDAAGLSDCGENDAWNYWYQRLMNAYNESVERQIMTEQAENAKLRELVDELYPLADYGAMDASELDRAHDLMRELGLEVG